VFGSRTRTWLPTALAFAALLLFTIAPQWWMPNTGNREYRWTFWQQFVGNSYVYFGVLLLAGLACWRWRSSARRHSAQAGTTSDRLVDQSARTEVSAALPGGVRTTR
jgi:hypothetical protein